MYYYRKNSKRIVLHTESCHHKRRIKRRHLGSVELNKAITSGYRFCKCCDPIGKKLRAERKQLLDYGQQNTLSLCWTRCGLCVVTPYSQWMIVRTDAEGGTALYHRNALPPGPKEAELYPGYHAQNVCFTNLYRYLKYIVKHDNYRRRHPLSAAVRKKEPPKKGTKRYRKAQKIQKNLQHSRAVQNVLKLIEQIAS